MGATGKTALRGNCRSPDTFRSRPWALLQVEGHA